MVKLATSRIQKNKPNDIEKVNGFPAENELQDLRFRLAHNLQSTLNLQTTLELFFSNIQSLVNISGVQYLNPEKKTDFSLGAISKHSAVYQVRSETTHLGKIQFYKKNDLQRN